MRFEKDVQKAKEFLKGLAREIGVDDIQKADRIFAAVLRVLRRRISPQEYLDFIAQLPICLKAEAVHDWRLSDFPDKSIKHLDDFIEAVLEEDRKTAQKDFGDKERAKEMVRGVFSYLKKHISEGEIKDLAAEMPKEIQEFILNA